MTDPYSALSEWKSFYEVLAGVAATFAGLLFVGLSIHVELLRRPAFVRVRSLARHTFFSYVFLALFSLVLLIPVHDVTGLRVAFLLNGGAFLALTLTEIYRIRAWRKPDTVRLPRMRVIYVLSALVYFSVMVAGVVLPRDLTIALATLVSPLISHLAWTTLSAWDLLMELREGPLDESTPPESQ